MISKTNTRRVALLATSCALALAAQVAAQAAETSPERTTVDQVVVTASANQQRLIDAPASISVVTEEDLHVRPIRDLTDILDRVEGVTINRSGNQRTIQLRGLGSAYTLFLIDGKRVNSTSAMFRGNDFDAGWVPVEAISRVEVVRGPMSSLYGSDAIGGVVNIITKPVGKVWSGSASADYIAQENRDAGDAYKAGFFASGPLVGDSLGLKIYGGYNRRLSDANSVNPSIGGVAQQGVRDKHEAYVDGTLAWTPDVANTVLANLGYNRLTHDGFPMERLDWSLTHKGEYGVAKTQLRAYGDRIENEVGNVTGQKNPNKAANAAIDGRITLPWDAARQTITLGAEWRRQKLEDPANLRGLPGTAAYNQNPETQVDQRAVFIEDEVRITDDLRLTVGDRYDDHENFGGHHSPRAYLVYHLTPNITFKGGAAKAFRAPTLLQNSPNWGSVSCGSATTGCYIIGSTELKPETATSRELGVRAEFDRFSGGVTIFSNDLKNMIDITNRTRDPVLARTYSNFVGLLPDGRPIFRYQNIAKVRSQGVEANTALKLNEQFDVVANYTRLDSKNRSNPTELAMIYQPKHSANVTLNWRPIHPWSLFATYNYVGEQYLSVSTNAAYNVKQQAYGMVDVGSAYRVSPDITVRAGVLNLADKTITRETSTEYNEEGRRFFVAATRRF